MKAGILLALALTGVAAAPADARPALATGCDEQQAFIAGDSAAVARRLPQGYAPVRTDSGDPLLFARAIRCDAITARGSTAPAMMASYGVVIDTPDGLGCACASPAPRGDVPPLCNWYTLRWICNRRPVVRWLPSAPP